MVISKEEFEKYDNDVGRAFIALQTKMKSLLKSADCGNLKNACIAQIHNPGGAELSQEWIDKISETESSDKLFDLLVRSPYWSWIDIRILEMIVEASENVQAQELLDNYKAVIFSKRLIDILPNCPSKAVKEKYYAKIVAKVENNFHEMTVADLSEFQSQFEEVIMDIKKRVCILDHLEKGCVEIHWYIPISCVDRAYQNAKAKSSQFNDLHLQYVRIGNYPCIPDPLKQANGISVSTTLDYAGKYAQIYSFII